MIKAILTDIEGTITRISFVKDILFPYAAKHLPKFVEQHQHVPEVAAQLHEVKHLIAKPTASTSEAIDALLNWIKNDEKVTPLKQLQGLIWQAGYENGDFTGHIYPDAFEFLNAQYTAKLNLYVYSSGSVKAQKLLFEYSDYGDIRPLFNAYFDTKVGGKKEAQSYLNIVEQLPYLASEILFLSDIVEELDAAKSAGLATLQLWRDGQTQSAAHPIITDFNQYTSNN
ncbi:enolase-phosphatase E1 [Pseudoalteromonas citrea]|uniref:Enolase-phosphatase E1 n=2 Tax=Pseudoalteromonas citrea TaxID=43655 RepID=A0AAD4FQS0_9GAMM|nr:acireductone synthase [Pseudoalteromonas citrea]KAF7767672.1 enolase-phosphatase E1 [Pseudoalteromonas citrea]